MRRRKFIQNAFAGALALVTAPAPGTSFAQTLQKNSISKKVFPTNGTAKLRGVNLGGWLVLEKWMTPTVFHGSDAEDEYNLCLGLSNKAAAILNQHRETFITANDFSWIKERGLNAVRLPVGYWALEAPKPYVEASRFVDFAFEQAQRNSLKLILDLHGAPGSQNGWDHSGRSGKIGWPKSPDNIKETLRVLESFAQRYGKHPALFGIELLNEPGPEISIEILKNFYQDAYSRIRKYAGTEVAILFHDSFRAMSWKNFMKEPEYKNVFIDTHLYQSFGEADRERNAQEQIVFALNRKNILEEMQREELPTFVGEWSLALPGHSLRGLSPFQNSLVTGAYADAQLLSFEHSSGWFFWSYKLESDSQWNFRYCIQRGWLPENFPEPVES